METYVHWEELEKFPNEKANNSLNFIYSFQTIYFMHKAIRTYKRHQTQTHRKHTQKYKVFELKKNLTVFFTFIRGITPTVLKQITYMYSEMTSLLGISLRSQPWLQKVTSAEWIRPFRWVTPSLQIKFCETSTKDRNKLLLAFSKPC